MTSFRILPAGESAVLVEFPETAGHHSPVSPHVLAFLHAAEDAAHRPAGVEEIIPAARTVLVCFDRSSVARDAVTRWCSSVAERLDDAYGGHARPQDAEAPGAGDRSSDPADGPRWHATDTPPDGTPPLTIPVAYDGPDLDDVAAATGLTADEVVAAHTSTPWVVAFTGFAPGFGYLVGGDRRLRVPRRDTPRTSVPAGSVGLAGPFSGVYPRSSPGGWQLIGRTGAPLWRSDRQPPALLEPGRTVRFEAMTP